MKYRVLFVASLLFIAFFQCCAQVKTNPIAKQENEYKHVPAETLLKQLESYTSKKQTYSLDRFFSNWNKLIRSNNQSFIKQNDTIGAIYTIYRVFYKPTDLLKLGKWEWGNKLNADAKYIVIPTAIAYAVVPDSILNDIDKHRDRLNDKMKQYSVIDDFRPMVNIPTGKVLYLTGEYAQALSTFLGTKSTKAGEGNIMNPSMPAGESEKRYNLIRPYIPVLHGHWGGWHLGTHPRISIIILNESLTKAYIDFRVGYQGGEATMIKIGNEWEINTSNTTWIE